MKLVSIGFGSFVSPERIVAAVEPESNPIKRVISQARETGRLVDATYGRRTEAVLVMDSGHVILCPLGAAELAARIENAGKGGTADEKG